MCIVYLLYSYIKICETILKRAVKIHMHSKTDVLFFDVLLILNICTSLK